MNERKKGKHGWRNESKKEEKKMRYKREGKKQGGHMDSVMVQAIRYNGGIKDRKKDG